MVWSPGFSRSAIQQFALLRVFGALPPAKAGTPCWRAATAEIDAPPLLGQQAHSVEAAGRAVRRGLRCVKDCAVAQQRAADTAPRSSVQCRVSFQGIDFSCDAGKGDLNFIANHRYRADAQNAPGIGGV